MLYGVAAGGGVRSIANNVRVYLSVCLRVAMFSRVFQKTARPNLVKFSTYVAGRRGSVVF